MKILETAHSRFLRAFCSLKMPTSNKTGENILIFANGGIGNIIYIYPLMKSLEKLHPHILCPNGEVLEILASNLNGCSLAVSPHTKLDFVPDTVVSNFLAQRNEEVRQIIDARIPCRIGHNWKGSAKYGWLFNLSFVIDDDKHEIDSNLDLIKPFAAEPAKEYFPISLPRRNVNEKFDILIAPHSSNDPRKDWGHYPDLLGRLTRYKIAAIGSPREHDTISAIVGNKPGVEVENLAGKYDLSQTAHLIKNSRLLISNDSGLAKIAEALATPHIQIFRWWTRVFVRCRTSNGINLIEPTVDQVYDQIEALMS